MYRAPSSSQFTYKYVKVTGHQARRGPTISFAPHRPDPIDQTRAVKMPSATRQLLHGCLVVVVCAPETKFAIPTGNLSFPRHGTEGRRGGGDAHCGTGAIERERESDRHVSTGTDTSALVSDV